jgi:hypothetical protein
LAMAVESGCIKIRMPLLESVVLSMPAPIRLMPFVSVRELLHVEEPAGTITVSPLAEEDTAALTSDKLALAAVRDAALTRLVIAVKTAQTLKNLFMPPKVLDLCQMCAHRRFNREGNRTAASCAQYQTHWLSS